MRRGPKWLALALVGTAFEACASARPEFKAALLSPRVSMGRRATLEIRASWQEDAGKSFRLLPPLIPDPKKLKLERIASEAASVPLPGGAKHVVRFVCTFEPLEEGEAETGDVQMRYLSTDISQIASSAPGQSADAQTHDIKSLKVHVTGPSLAWLWLTLLLVLAGAIAAGVVVVVVLAKQAQPRAASAQAPGLEASFLEKLLALRTLRIEGESKAYVGKVAELLTSYVEAKFGIDAADRAALAEHLDEKKAERLLEIVAVAEKIRYAGDPPAPAELDRIASFAESVIRDQMPEAKSDPLEHIRLKTS